MRPLRILPILLLALQAALAQPGPPDRSRRPHDPDPATLYQVSTLDALSQGIYQGAMSFGELARHGDFGLGTFNGLDGEMVAVDGRFYQVRSDGTVWRVPASATTPFAAVTHFRTQRWIAIREPTTMAELTRKLDAALGSGNYFYALKIHGTFKQVRARSVPRQVPPYPPLGNVVAMQSIFPLTDTQGTLVGFRTPAWAAGINAAGYHFHYIADDARAGGHALDFEIASAVVEIATLAEHTIHLPDDPGFAEATLPLP